MSSARTQGVKVLAEALPSILAGIVEHTQQEWTLEYEEGHSFGTFLRTEDKLELQLTIDSFPKPRKILVHTIWTPRGVDAWNNTVFASSLLHRGPLADPNTAIDLRWAVPRIAREIADRVISPATAIWPALKEALASVAMQRAAHDAFASEVATALRLPYIVTTLDGSTSFAENFAGTSLDGTRWVLTLDTRGGARLEAVLFGRQDITAMAEALGALPTRRALPPAAQQPALPAPAEPPEPPAAAPDQALAAE